MLPCGDRPLVSIVCSTFSRTPANGPAGTTIERVGEDHYQISLALAGFTPDEVSITAEQNTLTVEGRKAEKGGRQYLYHGISSRPFRRIFSLAEYVQVKGASFENGMLKIDLVREIPDAMKPRQIAITTGGDHQPVENKQAA